MVRWAALLLLTSGCSIFTDSFLIDDFSGDPFPIDVDTTSGAIQVGLAQDGQPDRVAVIDVLSPITISDGGSGVTPSIGYPQLVVLGAAGPGGPLTRPRAALDGPQVITLHPCEADTCTVGPDGAAVPYGAIIGADALAGDDVRLDLGVNQISVLANVAGDDSERSAVCDAVLPSPYRGGGTALINGTELGFGGRRITIGTCLAFDPDPTLLQSERGADVLLVVSTGVGVSLLSESAYARYRSEQHGAPPAVELLPAQTVTLSSGPVSGHLANVPALALVGNNSDAASRGPCRQVYAHHLLLAGDCTSGGDCPCQDGDAGNSDTFCSVPALAELTPTGGLPMLIIPDDDPTLQALRTELRPDQAEVDGVLGTSALRSLQLDADYPHDRVLLRCEDATCVARPELPDHDHRAEIQACLTRPAP